MLPEIDMNAEWGTNSIRIHSEFRVPHSETVETAGETRLTSGAEAPRLAAGSFGQLPWPPFAVTLISTTPCRGTLAE